MDALFARKAGPLSIVRGIHAKVPPTSAFIITGINYEGAVIRQILQHLKRWSPRPPERGPGQAVTHRQALFE
jgi:hypothetical protein